MDIGESLGKITNVYMGYTQHQDEVMFRKNGTGIKNAPLDLVYGATIGKGEAVINVRSGIKFHFR